MKTLRCLWLFPLLIVSCKSPSGDLTSSQKRDRYIGRYLGTLSGKTQNNNLLFVTIDKFPTDSAYGLISFDKGSGVVSGSIKCLIERDLILLPSNLTINDTTYYFQGLTDKNYTFHGTGTLDFLGGLTFQLTGASSGSASTPVTFNFNGGKY